MTTKFDWLVSTTLWLILVAVLVLSNGCAHYVYSNDRYMMTAKELCDDKVRRYDPNNGRFSCWKGKE